jgi:flagellar protein FlaG
MNYDLFIPPQTLESTAGVPFGTSRRETSVETREMSRAAAGPDVADLFTGPSSNEEVSSDERSTTKVKQAVELVNRLFDRSPVDLNLSIDDKTESLVIKLIERDTRKVIRQIPPDEILRLRQHLQELLGVIFDETV